jgi:hypothetical protein
MHRIGLRTAWILMPQLFRVVGLTTTTTTTTPASLIAECSPNTFLNLLIIIYAGRRWIRLGTRLAEMEIDSDFSSPEKSPGLLGR